MIKYSYVSKNLFLAVNMGNKKRKNSNYVTEKTLKAKAELERAKRNKKIAAIVAISTAIAVAVAALVVGIVFAVKSAGDDEVSLTVTHHATMTIEWTDGDKTRQDAIHIELYGDNAPIAVENFVKLINNGYYEGLKLNKVIKDYYIAGGESHVPTSPIKGEFAENGIENLIPHKFGTIYMSHKEGNDSATSDFFISLTSDYKKNFEGKFAAFGRVISGMDVLKKIANDKTPISDDGTLLPIEQPVIKSITVHEPH